jgi:hypothetical protein
MNIFTDKKKLIQILFGLAFIILIANIVADKLEIKHYTPVESSVSAEKINSKYLQALKNYGIQPKWIIKQKRYKSEDDSLLYKYEVEVPKDLPIALLINEITDSLGNSNVKIQSKELKIGGETQLRIFSGDNLKLKAVFNYNDDIVRKSSSGSLIIRGTENISEEDFNSLLKSPERFAVLLTPSKSSKNRIDRIINDQKELLVLISDGSNDMDYKMRAGFSGNRIRNSIRAIISDYSKAAFFVIDDRSKIYFSPAMKIIKDVLDRAKIKYFNLSSCSYLKPADEIEMKKQFEEYVKKLETNNKLLMLLTPDELDTIIPELIKFRKIGYKFVRPSVLLDKNQ